MTSARHLAYLALLWTLASACSRTKPPPLTEPERVALADTIRQAMRDYYQLLETAPCTQRDSIGLAGVSFEYGPLLYPSDTTITVADESSANRVIAESPCPSPVENARFVGNIEVQVLTRDHAVVAWKFDEDIRQPDSLRQRVMGVVLETKVRSRGGWRTTAAMGTHVPVGSPRRRE